MTIRQSSKTLARQFYEQLGYRVGDVERHIPNSRRPITKDLFGVADLVAIRANAPGTLYIQASGAGDHKAHIEAYEADPEKKDMIETILLSGNRFQIVSWGKKRRITSYQLKSRLEIDLPDDDLLLTVKNAPNLD